MPASLRLPWLAADLQQHASHGRPVFLFHHYGMDAKAEIDAGNDDGNGSFAIVRVADKPFDMVTCRWKDDQGGYELIGPTFSGPSDPGPAPPTTLAPDGG